MTQRLVQELERAIHHGDVEQAKHLAGELAVAKLDVCITVRIDDTSPIDMLDGSANTIRLKVNFDNSHLQEMGSFFVDVNPNVTFHALKQLLHEQYGFDPMMHRFIVGRLCPKDSDVLASCVLDDNFELLIEALDNRNASATKPRKMLPAATVTSSDLTSTNTSHNNRAQQDASPIEGMWSCMQCTYENHQSMPICEMCDMPKSNTSKADAAPATCHDEVIYVDDDGFPGMEKVGIGPLPDVIVMDTAQNLSSPASLKRKHRDVNYEALMAAEYVNLIENMEPFECPICFADIDSGCGVVLRDCLHMFCQNCLAEHIGYSQNAVVTCPFDNGTYQCQSTLQDREIRALVTNEVYERHLSLSAREAESKDKNSYHCATPDCIGWCSFDDDVNTFFCYVCRRLNCLTCRAVHDGQNCIEYQREMRAKAYSDPAAMIANSTLDELLKFGDAMKCPQCSVIIIKKDGCDWIQCTVCKTEICWVTRQARWGPKGHGDTSGGCRCNVNGHLCHPKCGNCH